jgi:hypothetical protein
MIKDKFVAIKDCIEGKYNKNLDCEMINSFKKGDKFDLEQPELYTEYVMSKEGYIMCAKNSPFYKEFFEGAF